ncbi:rod shape-determining protein MreD [Planomonospora sp. ID67723]|uniref:rod shape-determining protein MreD n=1 Tax=Planomonospora sp. ID67723 TaxID=2738134 RepID=UPI0018C41986|nr:rod shape-determining protein MreD [Planomonospora sp. ID67723]MBG0830383.1 rod shape-determining protein MreD [Planomonospora sp. ID67723]
MTRRDTTALSLILVVMILQVTVVNRFSLPGGVAPDLLLLAVVGYALVCGAESGAVMGFAAGLLDDILPPAAHVAGQRALVLCLVGYVAGRVMESREDAGPVVALGCAVAGPVVAAAVGGLMGEVPAGAEALRQLLPAAVAGNVLAAPPVVWTVARLVRGKVRPVPRPGYTALRSSALRSRS